MKRYITPYKIELNDGCSISLASLYQTYTYEGLLAGRPNPQFNERIREKARVEALRVFPDTNIYLVPAEESLFEGKQDPPPHGPYQHLAGIRCIARFKNYQTRNEELLWSSLTIIWFQDDYGLPIGEEALEEILKIPWHEVSDDTAD